MTKMARGNWQRRAEQASARKESRKERRRQRDRAISDAERRDRGDDDGGGENSDRDDGKPSPRPAVAEPGCSDYDVSGARVGDGDAESSPSLVPPPALSPAVLEHVLSYLPSGLSSGSLLPYAHPIGAISQVCRHWNECVGTKSSPAHVWRYMLSTEGWSQPTTFKEYDDDGGRHNLPRHIYLSHHGAMQAVRHLCRTASRTVASMEGPVSARRTAAGSSRRDAAAACAIASFGPSTKGGPSGRCVMLRLLRHGAGVEEDGTEGEAAFRPPLPPYVLAAFGADGTLRLYENQASGHDRAVSASRLKQVACVRCHPPAKNSHTISADICDDHVLCLSVTDDRSGSVAKQRFFLTVLSCEEDVLCAPSCGEGNIPAGGGGETYSLQDLLKDRFDHGEDWVYGSQGVVSVGKGLFLVDITGSAPLEVQRYLTIFCAFRRKMIWVREIPTGIMVGVELSVTTLPTEEGDDTFAVVVAWDDWEIPSLLLEITPKRHLHLRHQHRKTNQDNNYDLEDEVLARPFKTNDRGGLCENEDESESESDDEDNNHSDGISLVWERLDNSRPRTALTATHLVISDLLQKDDARKSVLSFYSLHDDEKDGGLLIDKRENDGKEREAQHRQSRRQKIVPAQNGPCGHLFLDQGYHVDALYAFRHDYLLVVCRSKTPAGTTSVSMETIWVILVHVCNQIEIGRQALLHHPVPSRSHLWGTGGDDGSKIFADGDHLATVLSNVGIFLLGPSHAVESFHGLQYGKKEGTLEKATPKKKKGGGRQKKNRSKKDGFARGMNMRG